MGVAGALGYFLSVLLHELSHSLVARTYGIEMRGITLFIFGGVAEMPGEPPYAPGGIRDRGGRAGGELRPRARRSAASASPAAPAAGRSGGGGARLPRRSSTASLALFNLVPAFPLDGGRILRAILWGWRKEPAPGPPASRRGSAPASACC